MIARCGATVMSVLVLSYMPVKHVVGQETRSPPPADTTSVINRSTLPKILTAVPWDSICTTQCRVILVDSIVHVMRGVGGIANRGRVFHIITVRERNGVVVPSRHVSWGRVVREDAGDTAAVFVALDTDRSAPPNTFFVVVLPPSGYATVITVQVVRRGDRWDVLRKGVETG